MNGQIDEEFMVSVNEFGVPHWLGFIAVSEQDNVTDLTRENYSKIYWKLKGIGMKIILEIDNKIIKNEFEGLCEIGMRERCCKAPIIKFTGVNETDKGFFSNVRLGMNLNKIKIWHEENKLLAMRVGIECEDGLGVYLISTQKPHLIQKRSSNWKIKDKVNVKFLEKELEIFIYVKDEKRKYKILKCEIFPIWEE